MANQKEPRRTNGRAMVHVYLKRDVLSKIDQQAKTESRTHRTEMIRVLIERGLNAKENQL